MCSYYYPEVPRSACPSQPQCLHHPIYSKDKLFLSSMYAPVVVICYFLQSVDGVEEANPTNTPDLRRRSNRATATGAATPSDPFSLGFGGFRRLMLPRGAEACSKGHSLFYGQGLGAPPPALRKVRTLYCIMLSPRWWK